MKLCPHRRGRPPLERERVLRWLRRRIVAGEYPPGDRIPSTRRLAALCGSNPATVEQALEQLREEGFIVSRRRVGRYVSEFPPHRYRVALVFPGHPGLVRDWRWTRHFLAAHLAAEEMTRSSSWQVKSYFDVQPGSDGCRALAADLERGGLAGVIFAYAPHELRNCALFARLKVPVIVGHEDILGRGLVVRFHREQFFDRAVECLRQTQRHRVAVLTVPSRSPVEVYDSLAGSGIQVELHDIVAVDPFHNAAAWVGHALRSVLRGNTAGGPDALIITDDHLVEAAMEVLETWPAFRSGRFQVIAHWNFPLGYAGPASVRLLGFDAREWLQRAIELVASQAGSGRGEPVLIPARFAEELVSPYGDPITVDQAIHHLQHAYACKMTEALP